MTLTEVKLYLRVDGDDDDATIKALMLSATNYVKQQTGKTKYLGGDILSDRLFTQCVKLLVAHWYENRALEIVGKTTALTHSADALINHIAMCGDYT